MFEFLANILGYALNFIYNIVNNYGLAIIIFTLILKGLMLPMNIKQQKTMKKSAKIQEKSRELQKKYSNDPVRLNQELVDLYKSENMSPMSGCLSSILQIVIIISVFLLVREPLTYMKKVPKDVIDGYVTEIKEAGQRTSNYQEIDVIKDKGNEDERVNINLDFCGLDLSLVPNANLKDYKVYIIPVLYVLTSFLSIKITTRKSKKNKTLAIAEKSDDSVNEENNKKDAAQEAEESMEMMTNSMNYMFPIMAITISFVTPLGLALYWLVSNVLIIIERLIIDRISEKIDKKEEEKNNA